MLIIPFDRRIDWSRPPLMSILLVVLNVLVFFVIQAGDEDTQEKAVAYYASSGLAAMEFPAFRAYMMETHPDAMPPEVDEALASQSPYWVLMLQTETEFVRRLHANIIITPEAPEYLKWRSSRRQFEALYREIVYVKYGLRTAEPSLSSLFGHMFLHGGLGHLLGNMFFLFAVGFLVEATLGRGTFLAAYLLSGLGAAGFDFLFDPGSLLPGIGASGAIAGLMGMYAVLYWTRRVRFFYFLIVYFDYVSLPAIVLLPLWLLNELYQLMAYSNSGVNYLAHLGGLCSGALIGFGARRFVSSFNTDFLEQEDQQQLFDQQLDEARELCRKLEYKRALPLLRRLHSQQTGHRVVLYNLHQCCRIAPSGEEYHRITQQILGLKERDPATRQLVQETFCDYLQYARPEPRLDAELIDSLARHLLSVRGVREVDLMLASLLKKPAVCTQLRNVVEGLLQQLEGLGETKKSAFYRGQLPAEGGLGMGQDGL